MEKSRSLRNCNNFSLSRVETENFIEVVAVVVAAVLLLLSSKQAAKLDTPAQAAIKQKARSCSSSSSTGSKRQQHARQQHAVQRRQQQQQHSNINDNDSSMRRASAAAHSPARLCCQLYNSQATLHSNTHSCNSSTHTPTHTHMCDCKKFFNKIKFNAAKCSSALGLVSLRFHFALQIALQTPLLTTTSSKSSVRPAGQARDSPRASASDRSSQSQRQLQSKPQMQMSYKMLCNAMHKKCKRDAAGRQLPSLPSYHSLSYTLLAAAIKYISATFLPSASRANMIKYCKCQKLYLLLHTNWDLLVGAGGCRRQQQGVQGSWRGSGGGGLECNSKLYKPIHPRPNAFLARPHLSFFCLFDFYFNNSSNNNS